MSLSDLTVKDIVLLTRLPTTTSLRILASILGVEASNLSRTIRKLEDHLGVKLLNRSNQGVSPTSEALVLAKRATEICEAIRNLPIKSSSATKPYERFLNIGSRGFVNTFVAPHFASTFLAQFSDSVGLRFFDLSPNETLSASRAHVIDVVIGFEDSSLGKNWEQIKVGRIAWRLYARPRNPVVALSRDTNLTATRVGHHCSFDGKAAVFTDGLLFDALGIRQVGHGAQTAYTALAIASATDQLACVPEIVAAAFIADHRVVELPISPEMSTDVYLSVHTERVQNQQKKLLCSVLKDIL